MDTTDFARLALDRLPLAEACLVVLEQALRAGDLDALYESHRARCYERVLSFEQFIYLLRDVLLTRQDSARSVLLDAAATGQLPVSLKSFYNKLAHMPARVSCALLAHVHTQLTPLLPDAMQSYVPASLRHFTVMGVDGKVVKRVPRRLKLLRHNQQTACELLGAKGLVAVDLHSGLPADMTACLDGVANETLLLAGLLDTLQARYEQLLMVGDRAYGVFQFAKQTHDRGIAFVYRLSASTTFVADPQQPARTSQDEFGRIVTDESGFITRGTKQTERIALRRISVSRASDQIVVITNLLERDKYSASDIIGLYRERWDLERVFADITKVFGLKHLIGTRPEASLVQVSMCLILCGVLRVVRQHIAAGHNCTVQEVSSEMLWQDVQEELIAAVKMTEPEQLPQMLEVGRSVQEAKSKLVGLLGGLWKPKYKTANRKPRTAQQAPLKRVKLKQKKGNTSVQRVLQASAKT